MAENKKSFLMYADFVHTFDSLSDEEAGRLIKHLLAYVNDRQPVAPDKLTQIAFEPIKQQFKRDLQKWEEIRGKRSLAGKTSADKKKQNEQVSTHVNTSEQTTTNSTVTVNDTVNVTVTDNVNVNDIKKKKREKKIFSPPSLEDFQNYFLENGFSVDLAIRAFKSYDVAGWIDSRGNPVLNWKQKCQNVWFKEENKEKNSAKKESYGTAKQNANDKRAGVENLRNLARAINRSDPSLQNPT